MSVCPFTASLPMEPICMMNGHGHVQTVVPVGTNIQMHLCWDHHVHVCSPPCSHGYQHSFSHPQCPGHPMEPILAMHRCSHDQTVVWGRKKNVLSLDLSDSLGHTKGIMHGCISVGTFLHKLYHVHTPSLASMGTNISFSSLGVCSSCLCLNVMCAIPLLC